MTPSAMPNPILDHIDDVAKQAHAQLHPLAQAAVSQAAPALSRIFEPPGGIGSLPTNPNQLAGGAQPMPSTAAPVGGTAPGGPEPATPRPIANAASMGRVPRTWGPLEQSQQEVSRLTTNPETDKPGWEQIKNPWLRTAAGIGNAALGGFFPRVAALTPGTTLHHNMLVRGAEGAEHQQEGQLDEAQKRESEQAQAEHLGAETQNLEHPPAPAPSYSTVNTEQGIVPFDRTTGSAGEPLKVNGETATPFEQEAKATAGETPLGDRVPQINKALEARYQVLHPGQQLPTHYALQPNATQKDAERISGMLKDEESAVGARTAHEQAQKNHEEAMANIAANRESSREIAASNRQDTRTHQDMEIGRKALDKAEADYRNSATSASALNDFIDMSKCGNKVAASSSPLEGTLAIVTSQGVKRINKTELEGTAGAGDLWDRIMARTGKWTAGQPVPPDLQKDYQELSKMLQKSAYSKYRAAHASIVKRYGLTNEDPLPEPGGGPATGGGKHGVYNQATGKTEWK